jgi:hypothetical protein
MKLGVALGATLGFWFGNVECINVGESLGL